MIWVLFLACSTTKSNPSDCSSLTEQRPKDECYHNALLKISSTELPKLIEQAKKIEDPLIRGAAVSAWVRDHNDEITQKQGMDLCELLDGRDRFYCMRRLSSPHLKR